MAEDKDEILDEKKASDNKKDKKKGKKNGFDAAVTDEGTMYLDGEEDDDESSISMALITMLIIVIWLAILCLLIKLDVGGFGSGVLYPVFKNVPVINNILPSKNVYLDDEQEFDNLNDAVDEIERLRAENEELKSQKEKAELSDTSNDEIATLKEEIKRLKTFEDSQIEFQKLKTEFYEEVVFAKEAPDIANYKAYYESIDPENAEYLYKQVVQQMSEDKELEEYVKAYSTMKPKSAAALFEQMTDNLELVAKILDAMDTDSRAKILNVMNPEVSARLTKMMDPE